MNRLIPFAAAALLFTSFVAFEHGASTDGAQASRETVAEHAMAALSPSTPEAPATTLVAESAASVATR